MMKLRQQFKRKKTFLYTVGTELLEFFFVIGNIINRFKKDYRNWQAIEPYAGSKGTDGNIPSKISNPVILGSNKGSRLRWQAHVLSVNSISCCLCQIQNPTLHGPLVRYS